MRVTEVRYEELRRTEQFENARLGVTVLVGEGESPAEAVKRARGFVQAHMQGDDDTQALAATRLVFDALSARADAAHAFEPGGLECGAADAAYRSPG